MRPALTALLCLGMAQPALADCSADAMLVFDGSASMAAPGLVLSDPPRIDEARRAMARALPLVEHTRRIGLITYGPGPEGSCDGVTFRFAPIPQAAQSILDVLQTVDPNGQTPLTKAVARAAETLDHRNRPAVIVLVTDGDDTCDGAPCALADRLAGEAADLTIHVLGFKIADAFAIGDLQRRPIPRAAIDAGCLADRTGGTYVLTDTVEDLVAALDRTLGCLVIGALPPTRRPA